MATASALLPLLVVAWLTLVGCAPQIPEEPMNTIVKLDMDANKKPEHKITDLNDEIEEVTHMDTNFDALKYKEPINANKDMIPRGKYKLTLFDERLYHDTDTQLDRVKRANYWKIIKTGITVFSLFTSGATIGWQVWTYIERCCKKIYDYDLCSKKKQYKKLVPVVVKNTKKLMRNMVKSKNLLEWVKACNDNNREIWIEIKNLKSFTDRIVKTLDPSVINKFRNKQAELEREVNKKNATVMNLSRKKFDDMFKTIFDDAEAMAWTFSGLFGEMLFYFAKFAIKENKASKMAGTLNTDYGKKLQNPRLQKVLGVTNGNIKAHMKNTARGVVNRKIGKSRFTKYVSRAAHLIGLLSSGVQILGIAFQEVKCKKHFNDAKKSLNDLRKADTGVKEQLKKVDKYHTNLKTKGWNYVKKQVTGARFTGLLQDIANVTKNAGRQTNKTKQGYETFMDFLQNIKTAKYNKTYIMQRNLIKALQTATFPFKCLYSKLRLVRNMMDDCRIGAASMEKLFDRGKRNYPTFNSTDCRDKAGIAYTFFADVKRIVGQRMINESLQADCVLNSKQMKQNACFLKDGEGLNATEIKDRLHITFVQAQFFIKDCPPRTRLTKKETRQVCNLRNEGMSSEKIASILGIPHLVQQIKNVTGCPTIPPLTTNETKLVCYYRNVKRYPDDIISFRLKKPVFQIRAVVCPTTQAPPTTTPAYVAKVCKMRNVWGMKDKDIADILNLDVAVVTAITCP